MTVSVLELIVLMDQIQVFMMHSARCEYNLIKIRCNFSIPNSRFPIPNS
ncbi:MAG: hypothetical protein F6K31_36100 [Symploca sp. SIO2G7]|nr:hypothetical protein [Symploca sp. SIO2G7]